MDFFEGLIMGLVPFFLRSARSDNIPLIYLTTESSVSGHTIALLYELMPIDPIQKSCTFGLRANTYPGTEILAFCNSISSAESV